MICKFSPPKMYFFDIISEGVKDRIYLYFLSSGREHHEHKRHQKR